MLLYINTTHTHTHTHSSTNQVKIRNIGKTAYDWVALTLLTCCHLGTNGKTKFKWAYGCYNGKRTVC